jgi:hypothetical protein
MTNHKQPQIHKTHHSPDLGEAITFPFIIYFVLLHKARIQMAFCLGIPKWESRNSHNWDSHNFGCFNPSLGLATKVKGCKVAGQERDLGVTSHVPESAKNVRE